MCEPDSAAAQSGSSRKRHAPDEAEQPGVGGGSGSSSGARLCAVCGDHTTELGSSAGSAASGSGTTSGSSGPAICDSCKAFFRRNGGRQHQCSRGSDCHVTVATRKHCRACRYRRCLAAGLRQSSSPPPLQQAPQAQQQQQQQPPPDKLSRIGNFGTAGSSGSASVGTTTGSTCADTDIPIEPVANWRDALLKVANYYGEDCTPMEAELIASLCVSLGECIDTDMAVPFAITHDLTRGLAQQLNDWSEMISQLEIFIQPAIRFCKQFLASQFFKAMPGWLPEHSVLLVKLRIHTILVPIFSHKFDPNSRQLSVSIDGKSYTVDPNRSIRDLDRSFMPGLSAVSSNDRYFEYLRKVTDGDLTLLGLFVLLKLFDLSLAEKDEMLEGMDRLAFNMFMRLAKCTRHAFVKHYDDRWLPKMRELCILFEWSKTFDLSLSTLFSSISSQSPTPLFAEIYT